jgi:hypothetical protein
LRSRELLKRYHDGSSCFFDNIDAAGGDARESHASVDEAHRARTSAAAGRNPSLYAGFSIKQWRRVPCRADAFQ